MDKKTLRKVFLSERKNLETRMHKMLNFMLMKSLREFLVEYDLRRIGVYYPINNEVDVTQLEEDYETYYPKVEEGGLVFYRNTGEFEDAVLGTKEPKSDVPINKNELDAVIVPGLVYDYALYRLGYGGGYYDDFLRDFKGLSVGVCFEQFRIEALPSRGHDIPVDILVTDNQIYESPHTDV